MIRIDELIWPELFIMGGGVSNASTSTARGCNFILEGAELEHIAEAIGGGHTSSGGPFSQRAAALLSEDAGAAEVLLTTSCTAALEMSALLLDLQPGDTVIVPSFTFVSSRGGVRPRRRRHQVLRHRAPAPWAPTRATSPSCSTTRSARSWSSTTPGSSATWTACARS